MRAIQRSERVLIHPDDADFLTDQQTRFYLAPPTPKLQALVADAAKIERTSEGVVIHHRSAQAGLEYLLGCLVKVENLLDMAGQPIEVPRAQHPLLAEGCLRVTEAGLASVPENVVGWLIQKVREETEVKEAERGES